MPMQIRRTLTANNPPTGLAEGQLSVELASSPPRLWVGVPVAISSNQRVQLNDFATQAYVTAAIAAAGPFLPLSGGTLTGPLVFASGQTMPGYMPLAGGIMTGPITFAAGQTIANYLPLAGSTMTGPITFAAGQTINGYLPLTGGTLTGTVTSNTIGSNIGLDINNTGTGDSLLIRNGATNRFEVAADGVTTINYAGSVQALYINNRVGAGSTGVWVDSDNGIGGHFAAWGVGGMAVYAQANTGATALELGPIGPQQAYTAIEVWRGAPDTSLRFAVQGDGSQAMTYDGTGTALDINNIGTGNSLVIHNGATNHFTIGSNGSVTMSPAFVTAMRSALGV